LKKAPCSLLLFSAVLPAFSQALNRSSPALFDTIALDTKIFDALNAHNADALMSMFSDDLEFYQDNDGVNVPA